MRTSQYTPPENRHLAKRISRHPVYQHLRQRNAQLHVDLVNARKETRQTPTYLAVAAELDDLHRRYQSVQISIANRDAAHDKVVTGLEAQLADAKALVSEYEIALLANDAELAEAALGEVQAA